MPRHSVAGRATIAGTNLLPLVSLYGAATVSLRVKEIGLYNTTDTALAVALARLSTAGTPGTGLTEAGIDDISHTAIGTGFAGHTVGPTITAGELRRADIGAAVGAGSIWVFGGYGLVIPDVANAGIGVIVPNGTGQILDYYIEWEE